jgi:hypothetical protein
MREQIDGDVEDPDERRWNVEDFRFYSKRFHYSLAQT